MLRKIMKSTMLDLKFTAKCLLEDMRRERAGTPEWWNLLTQLKLVEQEIKMKNTKKQT